MDSVDKFLCTDERDLLVISVEVKRPFDTSICRDIIRVYSHGINPVFKQVGRRTADRGICLFDCMFRPPRCSRDVSPDQIHGVRDCRVGILKTLKDAHPAFVDGSLNRWGRNRCFRWCQLLVNTRRDEQDNIPLGDNALKQVNSVGPFERDEKVRVDNVCFDGGK